MGSGQTVHSPWLYWVHSQMHMHPWSVVTAAQSHWEVTEQQKNCPLNQEKNWSDLIQQNISLWCQTDLKHSFQEAPGTVHRVLFIGIYLIKHGIESPLLMHTNCRSTQTSVSVHMCSLGLFLILSQGSSPDPKSYSIYCIFHKQYDHELNPSGLMVRDTAFLDSLGFLPLWIWILNLGLSWVGRDLRKTGSCLPNSHESGLYQKINLIIYNEKWFAAAKCGDSYVGQFASSLPMKETKTRNLLL